MSINVRFNWVEGFTLLELLVALAIFAVIAVMAYGGLNSVLSVREHTREQAAQLSRLQISLSRLQQDLEQYTARSVRNQYGDAEAGLVASRDQLTFTRTGWSNPLGQARSGLQRVQYRYQNNTLWRDYWRVLDQAQDSEPVSVAVLDDVSQLQWRLLDAQLNWRETWPLDDNQRDQVSLPTAVEDDTINKAETNTTAVSSRPQKQHALPLTLRAIELTLTVPRLGEITRLFAVTDQTYVPSTNTTQ